MKKIQTNIQLPKNYFSTKEEWEIVKDGVVKEFNLPDDWSKYLRIYFENSNFVIYKGVMNWKNRVAQFKLDGTNFSYTNLQRLKVLDAYNVEKERLKKSFENYEKLNVVIKYFHDVISKKIDFDGRQFNVSVIANDELLLNIPRNDDDDYKLITKQFFLPFVRIRLDFDFENNRVKSYELKDIYFDTHGLCYSQINDFVKEANEFKNLCYGFINTHLSTYLN